MQLLLPRADHTLLLFSTGHKQQSPTLHLLTRTVRALHESNLFISTAALDDGGDRCV
jgi:hypothetical protein